MQSSEVFVRQTLAVLFPLSFECSKEKNDKHGSLEISTRKYAKKCIHGVLRFYNADASYSVGLSKLYHHRYSLTFPSHRSKNTVL